MMIIRSNDINANYNDSIFLKPYTYTCRYTQRSMNGKIVLQAYLSISQVVIDSSCWPKKGEKIVHGETTVYTQVVITVITLF